jgi:hypothetical protein
MDNKRSARDRATDIIQTVRNAWWPTPVPASELIDALAAHGDLLQELHDEQLMVRNRP